MIEGKSVLAVIPARAGSKRCPGKNMRRYRGKTLVEWAVESARESKYLDELVVSSEDQNILAHARSLGVTALQRPDWLATDKATTEGILIHMLYTWRWADWVVLLQPTSPLRTGDDIDLCIERSRLDMGVGCLTVNEHGHRNGAVYVVDSTWLVSSACFHRDLDRNLLIMPNRRSLDIDYDTDFSFNPDSEIEPGYRKMMEKQRENR